MKTLTLLMVILSIISLAWVRFDKSCVSSKAIGKYHCSDGRDITITESKQTYKVKLENFGISSGDYNAICDNDQLKVELPMLGKTVLNFDTSYRFVRFLNKQFNRQ